MMRPRWFLLCLIGATALATNACSSDSEGPTGPGEEVLEPEDMGGLEGEGKFEAWDSANNPAYVDSNFSYFVHQLPAEGHGPVPIPGDYWATQSDNLNHEWDGPGSSPAEKFGKAFDKLGVPEAITKLHGIESASYKKECTADGNECKDETDGSSCAIPRGADKGRCIPGWWGICHGWAPYALSEPAAINPVERNGVTFYPGDLEGLMSLAYTDVPTKFLSRRCNKDKPTMDPTGRIEATECRDMNPGSWHVLATNMMGLRNKGFVIDATYDLQVWNQPVYGYKVTNAVDGALPELSKQEAISKLGADLKLTELFATTEIKKDENKDGSYTAEADGEYIVKLSGTGDADLYVRKGEAPTKDTYDCRPYGGTAQEECKVTLAAGETVHYMVVGYSETSSVQLGVAVPGEVGEYKYNTAAKRFFYVEMDLTYIRESRPAKTSHVDQALTSYSTTKHYKYILETDDDGKILGGEWVGDSRDNHPDFAWWPTGKPRSSMAGGLITYNEVKSLNDEAAAPPPVDETVTVLDDVNVSVTSTNWQSKYGSVVVEEGFKKLEVTMTGSGDADLYVRVSRNPTVYTSDCKSVTAGTSAETCTVELSGFEEKIYFVRARSKTPGTKVTVVAKKIR
jgi:Transglutaminase elicitor/Bacterial pre-peptidase C-terminal domain